MGRRGKPLSLNGEMARRLESAWLSHGVPEEIALRQETEMRHFDYPWWNF